MLTQAQLKEILHYDPITGMFTWVGKRNFKKSNAKVGCMFRGYLRIKFNGTQYGAHRLAILYMTGDWPKQCVDHINGISSDNRWENLRDVSLAINAQNRHKCVNSNGYTGVMRHKVGGGFLAQIRVKGTLLRLGTYRSAESAHQAYLDAKRRYHEGCTV